MENTQGAPAPQGIATSSNRWVADVRKNGREVVRIQLSTWKGAELVSIRVWYDAGAGEMLPGKAGIALKVEKLLELQVAIAKAIDAAKAEGHL